MSVPISLGYLAPRILHERMAWDKDFVYRHVLLDPYPTPPEAQCLIQRQHALHQDMANKGILGQRPYLLHPQPAASMRWALAKGLLASASDAVRAKATVVSLQASYANGEAAAGSDAGATSTPSCHPDVAASA